MANTLSKEKGLAHGRLEIDGVYVYELGQVGGNTPGRLDVGEKSQIRQLFTLESYELLARMIIRIKEPPVSSNVAWDLIGQADGNIIYKRRLHPLGRILTITDIGLSYKGASSPANIRIRLEAVSP